MMRRAALAAVFTLMATACAAGAGEPHVAPGFRIERIATVEDARELAIAPNGDLFVGTYGNEIDIVQHAESAHPAAPHAFARFDDSPAAGVALGDGALFVGTQFGVYRIPYATGDAQARSKPEKLAAVRSSGAARDHRTTSVAWNGSTLYASVGSSCNACDPELDDTRATIQRVDLERGGLHAVAIRIRNAIALAIDPQSHALWAGVAGVDDLAPGHPYEIFDDVTAHATPADYGWPRCYENRKANPQWPGTCARASVPRVVFPAYETPIGAVFYPLDAHGRYAFPQRYRGGAFVTLHGSWHGPANGLPGYAPPRVVFVPMHGDAPLRPIDWNDPAAQWTEFAGGYQSGGTIVRIGRPTGIAVGPEGSLFVADDMTGAIYRIRPR
jgi:glucose/arabinose dehydrogenase